MRLARNNLETSRIKWDRHLLLLNRNNTLYCRLDVIYLLQHLFNNRDHMINEDTAEVDEFIDIRGVLWYFLPFAQTVKLLSKEQIAILLDILQIILNTFISEEEYIT